MYIAVVKSACNYLLFFVSAMLFICCSSLRQSNFSPLNKLSPQQARSDLLVLKNILEANHPSLYWYTTKDSLDGFFAATGASITDSLNELQFKNKVAWVINKIHCGHTAVRSSNAYNRYYAKKTLPQFPLSLKVWGDSVVVVNNSFRSDRTLKRGTIITGINGYSNRTLLDSIYQLISTDGYTVNFKQQIVSFNFPFYFANTFGLDSQYTIRYIDSLGINKTTTVKNFFPRRQTRARAVPESLPKISRREFREYRLMTKRSMLIDTGLSTAILKINTFSGGHLQSFFRRSFRKIKDDNIKNLVVDIRENGGGDIISSTRLTQYLINHRFKVADTVAGISRSFKYRSHIKPWFIYWLSMRITGRRHQDGRIHFNYFEKHQFKPKEQYHFNGNTYIVAGGYSFSAATLFAGALKGQKNVTLVGEETGGGYYGNSAMHLPVISLPQSNIRVVLPLYRIILDKDREKTGRGIFPDVEVKPSSNAIRNAVDAKLEKVRQLIIAGKK